MLFVRRIASAVSHGSRTKPCDFFLTCFLSNSKRVSFHDLKFNPSHAIHVRVSRSSEDFCRFSSFRRQRKKTQWTTCAAQKLLECTPLDTVETTRAGVP